VATESNSIRSTLLKVDFDDRVALGPYTLAIKSKGRSIFGQQRRLSWQQCWPRQAVEFKLLPICCQNHISSSRLCRKSTVTETGDKSATKSTVLNSTLSPVCTGLYSEILWNKSVKSPPPSVCLALPSSTPATWLDQSAIDRLVRTGDRRTNKQKDITIA